MNQELPIYCAVKRPAFGPCDTHLNHCDAIKERRAKKNRIAEWNKTVLSFISLFGPTLVRQWELKSVDYLSIKSLLLGTTTWPYFEQWNQYLSNIMQEVCIWWSNTLSPCTLAMLSLEKNLDVWEELTPDKVESVNERELVRISSRALKPKMSPKMRFDRPCWGISETLYKAYW
jgi:hypothetical protein